MCQTHGVSDRTMVSTVLVYMWVRRSTSGHAEVDWSAARGNGTPAATVVHKILYGTASDTLLRIKHSRGRQPGVTHSEVVSTSSSPNERETLFILKGDGLSSQCVWLRAKGAKCVRACVLTSSWAEVHQQEGVAWAQFIRHSAQDLSDRGRHRHSYGGVSVITAVHLKQDYRYKTQRHFIVKKWCTVLLVQ